MPSVCGWLIPKQLETLSPEIRAAMSRTLQHANKGLGDTSVAVCAFGELTFIEVFCGGFPRHIAFEYPSTDDLELARALECPVWQVRSAGNGVHVLQWAADGTLTREWDVGELAELSKSSGIDFKKLKKRPTRGEVYELVPDAQLDNEGARERKRKSIHEWELLIRAGQDGGEGPRIIGELREELAELEKPLA